MLGIIAAVLIVLWLLGFFAFHVTGAFIHVALVVGVVLLVVHFMRGSMQAYRAPVKFIDQTHAIVGTAHEGRGRERRGAISLGQGRRRFQFNST